MNLGSLLAGLKAKKLESEKQNSNETIVEPSATKDVAFGTLNSDLHKS